MITTATTGTMSDAQFAGDGSEVVDINGVKGVLRADGSGVSLVWEPRAGRQVQIRAYGFDGEAVLHVARGLERQPAGEGWTPPALDAPVTQVGVQGRDDYVRETGAKSSQLWTRGKLGASPQLELRVNGPVQPVSFDLWVAGLLSPEVEAETITVRGQQAALITLPPPGPNSRVATGEDDVRNEYRVTWLEGGRWIAELRSDGMRKIEVLAAAESLHELDDGAWRAWLDEH